MAKITWKGAALLAPVPAVLVSCASGRAQNLLTVAWTGIVCSDPPKTYISLRQERYSFDLIRQSGEFCINLPTDKMARAVDYCGVRTGRGEDKFAACALTPSASSRVGCPSVAECPLTLECRVSDTLPLGSHTLFLADILAVTVEDSLLDTADRLRLERAGLMAYAHGEYFSLGGSLGRFGFSVRKKRKGR